MNTTGNQAKKREHYFNGCVFGIVLLGGLAWIATHLLFYSFPPTLSSDPPLVNIVGWHRGHPEGLVVWEPFRDQVNLGIPCPEAFDLQSVVTSLSPAAVRGDCLFLVTSPSISDKSSTAIQIWNWLPSWRKIKTVPLSIMGCYALACSPNGRILAVCGLKDSQMIVSLLDWKQNKTLFTHRLSDKQTEIRSLSCTDTGDIYVVPKQGYSIKIASSHAETTLASYQEIVANRKGVFGVNSVLNRGTVTLIVTPLGEVGTELVYVCDVMEPLHWIPASPTYVWATLDRAVCSDDGEWWVQRVRESEQKARLVYWKLGQSTCFFRGACSRFTPIGIHTLK